MVSIKNLDGYRDIFWIVLSLVLAIISISLFSSPQNQMLLYVLLGQVTLGMLVLWYLIRVEQQIPVFDVGFILICVTILYCAYPLFAFVMTDFQWSIISDNRMRAYKPSSSELANFSLHHLTYIAGLVFGYLVLRKRSVRLIDLPQKVEISTLSIFIIVFLYVAIVTYFQILGLLKPIELPYIVLQINNNLSSIKFILSIALMYYGLCHWHNKWLRTAVIIYLLCQVYFTLSGQHGRTYLFLTLIAAVMLYHRLVSSLTFSKAFYLFVFALILFIFVGYKKANIFYYFGEYSMWSATNEFTSLFGTAYDLYMREEVTEIPASLHLNDFLLLIPSQLLNFEKWSTSQWYLEVIGLRGTGVGMMFGVISQGIIGGGILELLLRGLFLGAAVAIFHNWYVRKAGLFWMNIAYVFIAVRIYYTYRAGTGYIFYYIIYQLIPCVILVLITQKLVGLIFPEKFKKPETPTHI